MPRSHPASSVIFGAVLTFATEVLSCPVCDAGTGQQVRAGLFDGSVGTNLVATLVPFPVVLLFVAWIHFGSPKGKSAPPKNDRIENGD
jgi:hypothetical protein